MSIIFVVLNMVLEQVYSFLAQVWSMVCDLLQPLFVRYFSFVELDIGASLSI